MMRFFIYFLFLGCSCGMSCTSNTASENTAQQTSSENGPFSISKASRNAGTADDRAQPCTKSYTEGVPISPDANNPQNRIIGATKDGWYRIIVRNQGAIPIILHKSGAKAALYTSLQYPECLSNRNYWSLSNDGSVLRFKGEKETEFELMANNGAWVLQLPVGKVYGLMAYRCEDCL
jgi:hypothetical protein